MIESTDAAGGSESAHALQCMEVWGGTHAVRDAVSVPGLDLFIVSTPHEDAAGGGDIHYVSMCGMGAISRVVVADVSGHGREINELAGKLRGLMRAHINTADQTRFTRSLNTEFGALAERGRFATALMATYYAPSDHLIVCNAGHPRPVWYDASSQRWSALGEHHERAVRETRRSEGPANIPLGIIEPTEFSQFAVPLGKDDLVVLFTDALVEARSPDGTLLGEDGLLRVLAECDCSTPENLADQVQERVREYSGGAPAEDDLTIVVMHHNAADPPKAGLGALLTALGRRLGLLSLPGE